MIPAVWDFLGTLILLVCWGSVITLRTGQVGQRLRHFSVLGNGSPPVDDSQTALPVNRFEQGGRSISQAWLAGCRCLRASQATSQPDGLLPGLFVSFAISQLASPTWGALAFALVIAGRRPQRADIALAVWLAVAGAWELREAAHLTDGLGVGLALSLPPLVLLGMTAPTVWEIAILEGTANWLAWAERLLMRASLASFLLVNLPVATLFQPYLFLMAALILDCGFQWAEQQEIWQRLRQKVLAVSLWISLIPLLATLAVVQQFGWDLWLISLANLVVLTLISLVSPAILAARPSREAGS